MEYKFVFIVIAIIFWVIKTISKNSDGNKVTTSKKPRRQAASNDKKSIDDIFNEFVKEIENKNKKTAQKPAVAPVKKPAYKAPVKQALDWQKVDRTHIAEKKQLLDHEDYHGISHRIDPSHKGMEIAETEGEVFQFDVSTVDWKQAIISKEILDRRFS